MYYKSSLGHLVRRTTSDTRHWKTNRKAVKVATKLPPLDRCSVPLWRVLSVETKETKCLYTKAAKPIFEIVAGKNRQVGSEPATKAGFVLKQHVITLEYFRGQTLQFVRTRNIVKDMRDGENMTLGQFERFVTAKVGETFKLPKLED